MLSQLKFSGSIRDYIERDMICRMKEESQKLSTTCGVSPSAICEINQHLFALEAGNHIKIHGDARLLDLEYFSVEVITEKGQTWYLFNKSVMYFPSTKLGRYVKKAPLFQK